MVKTEDRAEAGQPPQPRMPPVRWPTERWAGFVVALALAALAAAMVATGLFDVGQGGDLPRKIAWLLAIIPGLVAIVNYWASESPRAERTGNAVTRWLKELRDRYKDDEQAIPMLARIDAHLHHDVALDQPRFPYTLFGAALLTMVFGVVAQLADGPWGLGVKETSELTGRPSPSPDVASRPSVQPPPAVHSDLSGTPGPSPSPSPATAASPSESPAPSSSPARQATGPGVPTGPEPPPPNVPEQKGPILGETRRGVVFAGLGAYVFALQLLIGRINTGSLTARFLVRLSAQSAIAVILGVVAAQLGVGFAVATERQSLFLYFLLGLFPGLVRQALQRRGRSIFAPDDPGNEPLALSLIDGIDDDVADRLQEMGVSDVQHLSTVDPIDFMLKAGYSPMRVLDWIDQAMLITYVRRRIVAARVYGIRGAIDLSVLYQDFDPKATGDTSAAVEAARANVIVHALAVRMELPQEVLLSIGRAMMDDDNVRFVWLLWMNRLYWDHDEEPDSDEEPPAEDVAGSAAGATQAPATPEPVVPSPTEDGAKLSPG